MSGQPRWMAIGEISRVREFTRRDVDRWSEWGRHEDPLFSSYNPTQMSGAMRDSWFDDLVNRQGQLPFAIENLDRELVGRLFLRHVRQRSRCAVSRSGLRYRCASGVPGVLFRLGSLQQDVPERRGVQRAGTTELR